MKIHVEVWSNIHYVAELKIQVFRVMLPILVLILIYIAYCLIGHYENSKKWYTKRPHIGGIY